MSRPVFRSGHHSCDRGHGQDVKHGVRERGEVHEGQRRRDPGQRGNDVGAREAPSRPRDGVGAPMRGGERPAPYAGAKRS